MLRGCRYETIEEMKKSVTKVIDMFTQEEFHVAFQKLLDRYNKCIAAGGDFFEGDKSFMHVLIIKVPIRKKSGNLFNDPRKYTQICVYIYKKNGELLVSLKPQNSSIYTFTQITVSEIQNYSNANTHTHTHTHTQL